uniref:Uncharacterized protein n=1 Tax=Bursaphelenchus xylophilus TaxID=6326 RepID=A0A1I7S1G3_BURXY
MGRNHRLLESQQIFLMIKIKESFPLVQDFGPPQRSRYEGFFHLRRHLLGDQKDRRVARIKAEKVPFILHGREGVYFIGLGPGINKSSCYNPFGRCTAQNTCAVGSPLEPPTFSPPTCLNTNFHDLSH